MPVRPICSVRVSDDSGNSENASCMINYEMQLANICIFFGVRMYRDGLAVELY